MCLFPSRFIFITVVLFSMMSSSESNFPDTLEGFGYAFNEEGKLCKIDPETNNTTENPFEFNVSDDAVYNQKRYEALGEVITKYVYGLLEVDLGLQKLKVPKDGDEMESTFVFASPNIFMNTERLLILIHGSGVVRAGQWARSLIINDSIQTGTQIPNIRKAQELGYEILVLNTNDNIRFICKQPVEIKESASPEEHANYVWNNYVKQINPKHIAIIAHSYGGCVTLDLAVKHFSDFEDKVFAIALTDSVHNVRYQKVPSKVMKYLKKVAINWAAHNSPLDTPLKMPIKEDIPRVSAGHTKHEMTTWSSFESINKFIQERYDSLTGKEEL